MTVVGFGTWNGLERIKPGTIGYPMPGMEARIAEDRELLLRGLSMVSGYYKDPVRTADPTPPTRSPATSRPSTSDSRPNRSWRSRS